MQEGKKDESASTSEVPPRRHRVQLDFSQSAYDELLELQKGNNFPTTTATVRSALKLYKWWTDSVAAGDEILVRHPDQSVEKITLDPSTTA